MASFSGTVLMCGYFRWIVTTWWSALRRKPAMPGLLVISRGYAWRLSGRSVGVADVLAEGMA